MRHQTATRAVGWLAFGGLVVGLAWLSLFVGARPVTIDQVWGAMFGDVSGWAYDVVVGYRVPRALLGVIVGAALGTAGALIQTLMRNPLGDPQILGVNAGASLAVVIAVGLLGLTSIWSYVWFAFAGAIAAMAVVYGLGTAGHGPMTPLRVTMAGIAVTAVLSGAVRGIALLNPDAFDVMRVWEVGSLAGRGMPIVGAVVGFVAVGVLVALVISRPLDAIAMGDDLARGMGVDVARTRVVALVAITLLCGAATAAAGPIAFVGLMVPHAVRFIVGASQLWVTAYSMVAGAALVLVADMVGRVLIRPDEIPVGVVTAFIGAPILILLVRRREVSRG